MENVIYLQKIEIDLITRDTQIINENHWKKRFLRESQYHYSDKEKSVVWAGGSGKKLIKYDEILQQSKYYPIESVWRIIPYKEKIYFVEFCFQFSRFQMLFFDFFLFLSQLMNY